MSENSEKTRIERVYRERELKIPPWKYRKNNFSYLYSFQSLERTLFSFLSKNDLDISELKILDVGCGDGNFLQYLISVGADPAKCFGIDIYDKRIKVAKKKNPKVNLISGDAQKLPFGDEMFDIIFQMTTFTSILNNKIKFNIANEMNRVLKFKGKIIWYDFFIQNPYNRNVRSISKKEIRDLFLNYSTKFHRITLAPPLMNMLASLSKILPVILEDFKIFNTHYFAILEKMSINNSRNVVILKTRIDDLEEIAQIHTESFAGFAHLLLGRRYTKKLLKSYINNSSMICLVAKKDKHTIGYIFGGEERECRKIREELLPDAALALLTHFWILFNRKFIQSLITWLRSRFNVAPENVKENKKNLHLVSIAVSRYCRRKKIATILMEEFISTAKKKKFSEVLLTVDARNFPVRELYRSKSYNLYKRSNGRIIKRLIIDES